MIQVDHHHHQHQHQQPLRQEYNGGALPPSNYYYLHSSSGHSDALATASNLYSMQQSMDHDTSVQFSAPASVPVSTAVYHDSPRMDDSAVANAVAERDQFPTSVEFESIVQGYLDNLSSKKRDKALIDRHRYSLIIRVLKDPRNTAISTAQFRFWVKKMFQLVPLYSGMEMVCHDNKPVAMREEIYSILVKAHRQANHGGRDKTSALVRRQYSWIPKELIARFVRHCPFCISRRNGSSSPPIGLLPRTPPDYTTAMSARGSSCSTQPPPMTSLPYLPMELKSASTEEDDLNATTKGHSVWPSTSRHHHHQQQQQQQQQYYSPPAGAASPPSPASGPASVSFGVATSPTAPPASSCSGMPPASLEASSALYHHPSLLPSCDIASLGYGDVPTNGHVGHPPSYGSMCYPGAPDSMLPITATPPQQHQARQQQQQQQQQQGSADISAVATTGSYYYAHHQQSAQHVPYVGNSRTLKQPRGGRDNIMLHHPLYTLSSPSPSSSFSSSSSSSASSSSSPVSPSNSTATPPFATSSSSMAYPQNMYMQHPASSAAGTAASGEAMELIGQHRPF